MPRNKPVAEAGPGAHPVQGVTPLAAWGVITGLTLFAAFRARPVPWGVVGPLALVTSAGVLVRSTLGAPGGVRSLFGLVLPRRAAAGWILAGTLLGAGAGVAYRLHAGLGPWPGSFGTFVILAAIIGATEELVYRGFVQGGLRGDGVFPAVVFAAAGHSAYKVLLFAWRPGVAHADLLFLGVATFLAGLLIGGLREAAQSLAPAVAAHAAFDLVLYGAFTSAPWWVWH
jgi:membrane protease YdiL (CAAX protease family)